MTRKGITPVVAVVLLLMMTVAAAGAAYLWASGLLSEQQQEASGRLNTEAQFRGLQCSTSGDISFTVSNTGSRDISADTVDVFVYNVSTGNLYTHDETSKSAPFTSGEVWSGSVSLGKPLAAGAEYRFVLEFPLEESYSIARECQAGS